MTGETAIEAFVEHVAASARDGSFVRLVLSSPAAAVSLVRRVVGRLISLPEGPSLSFTREEPTRHTTHNLPVTEVSDWLRTVLGTEYRAALLETTRRDWQLSRLRNGPWRLIPHRPRCVTPPGRAHDQPRNRAIDDSARDWLSALGLVDAEGQPLPRRAAKFHQVMRYAEIFRHLLAECSWSEGQPLKVADMGCGRGHLTFAAWQLLNRQLKFRAEVLGIEARPELVEAARQLTRQLNLERLRFIPGDIAEATLPSLDILIALHACNTATDAAISRGVQQGARLIMVAPCCHQEVRPQLANPEPLGPVLRHGIMAERLAEWATDGLRALYLEAAGYRVKVIEFVPSEHTPKNLLIAGIRSTPPVDSHTARQRVTAFREFFGIHRHALDSLPGV